MAKVIEAGRALQAAGTTCAKGMRQEKPGLNEPVGPQEEA